MPNAKRAGFQSAKPARKAVKPTAPKFKHGWQPDLPDHRDWSYFHKIFIPYIRALDRGSIYTRKKDLRDIMPPIYNQGSLGSCTANAIAAAMAALHIKQDEIYMERSRLFIYYNERVIEHTTAYDSGAMIRDGIKSVAKQGACSEELWAYDVSRFAEKPPRQCYVDAKDAQITSYYRLENHSSSGTSLTQLLEHCLCDGYPFVFGFSAYEELMSDKVAKSGILPLPKKGSQLIGGHAVLCVGFDRDKRRFLVRNSWGDSWGIGGYFWMPYDYVTNPDLADDFWTIRAEE